MTLADGPGERRACCASRSPTPASASTPSGCAALFEPFSQADATDHAPLRRHRPGPVHLQAAGRADGRPDRLSTASRAWAAASGSPSPMRPALGLEADLRARSHRHAGAGRRRRRRRPRGSREQPGQLGHQPRRPPTAPRRCGLLRAAAEAGAPSRPRSSPPLPEHRRPGLVRAISDVPALRSTRLIMVVSSPVEAAGRGRRRRQRPAWPSRSAPRGCTTSCSPRCTARARSRRRHRVGRGSAGRRRRRRRTPRPGGRGQRDQPVRRHAPPAQLRPRGRRRRQRPGGDRR